MEKNSSLIDGIIREIVRGEKEAYRAVYFYGAAEPVGQVLEKVVESSRASNPKAKIMRLDGPGFVEALLNAVREGRQDHYIRSVCDCDLFIFQGIESVSGKSTTMEVLYGILDYLLETHVPMVITGGEMPQGFYTLEDRIRAQLHGCLCCAV